MASAAPQRYDGGVRTTLPHLRALDGVRGLAVAAVLAFHGGRLRGGFLGVDAFFVLSGFLITALLLTEHAGSGRIGLGAFWARRARRLLPALLLMLAVVLVVSRWLLPAGELGALRADALATTGYVANWRLMDRGGGYFAQTAPPSPLQHTWSLAIEEQFYLIWPLLLLALLAATRPEGPRRRTVVVTACLVGAAASTLAGAILSRGIVTDRVYYGTETRAVALLVGCAVAALLVGRPAAEGRHRLLGGLALLGAAVTAGLWVHADGGAPWLYHGGLLAAALAVAAVIAHAVRSPHSPTARVLAVPPLVWLGRISYGVYLWHWPLFQWLDEERTGVGGLQLLVLRCAATIAVATVSYAAVERPLRTAPWLRRPLLTPSSAGAAMAATAAIAVLATVPPAVPQGPPVNVDRALSKVMAAPRPGRSARTAAPAPIQRPGRAPGQLPRIDFFGDSVSWTLGTYLPPQHELAISVRALQGCGIATLPDIRYLDAPHTNYPGCDAWEARWRKHVKADDPDVSVVLLDRWELMDRRLGGRYQHVGDPQFDAYLDQQLDLALRIVGGRGAHVIVLTAPYTHRAERPDGSLYPEDSPARVDAWNVLLRAAAAQYHATVIDLNKEACPHGIFTWSVDGVRIRSDGLHFTPQGVRQVLAPWLLPQLAAAAVDAPAQ
jgi:peptidoglycan/LPS O-acetylase OafA/YrhL